MKKTGFICVVFLCIGASIAWSKNRPISSKPTSQPTSKPTSQPKSIPTSRPHSLKKASKHEPAWETLTLAKARAPANLKNPHSVEVRIRLKFSTGKPAAHLLTGLLWSYRGKKTPLARVKSDKHGRVRYKLHSNRPGNPYLVVIYRSKLKWLSMPKPKNISFPLEIQLNIKVEKGQGIKSLAIVYSPDTAKRAYIFYYATIYYEQPKSLWLPWSKRERGFAAGKYQNRYKFSKGQLFFTPTQNQSNNLSYRGFQSLSKDKLHYKVFCKKALPKIALFLPIGYTANATRILSKRTTRLGKGADRASYTMFQLPAKKAGEYLSFTVAPIAIKTIAEGIQHLKSKHKTLRKVAATALARMGKQAIPALISQLKGKTSHVTTGAQDALKTIGKTAIPNLFKAMTSAKKTTTHRERISYVLYELGRTTDAGFPILFNCLKKCKTDLLKGLAGYALSTVVGKAPIAIPKLTQLLRKTKSTNVKIYVLDAFSQIGPKTSSVVPLIVQLLQEKKKHVRCRAANALYNMGTYAKIAHPALLKAFKSSSPKGHFKNFAIEALLRVDPSKAAPTLLGLLNSKKLHVQKMAVKRLSRCPKKAGSFLPILSKKLHGKLDPSLRKLIVKTRNQLEGLQIIFRKPHLSPTPKK